jgi:hypothetical protein
MNFVQTNDKNFNAILIKKAHYIKYNKKKNSKNIKTNKNILKVY